MAWLKSGFERDLFKQLKQAKVKFGYETRKLPYTISKNYIPDFVLGNGIIIEAKGVLTPMDRAKMKAVKNGHPELSIRFVFQNANNKLNRFSKTTYGEWATKHGFPWAHKRIPKEWFTG